LENSKEKGKYQEFFSKNPIEKWNSDRNLIIIDSPFIITQRSLVIF